MAFLFFSQAVAVLAVGMGWRRLALASSLTGVLIGLAVFLTHFRLPPDTAL